MTTSPHQKNTFDSIEEAIENIQMMRRYKPYQYGGTWHFAKIGETAYARRTRSSLNSIAVKAGLLSFSVHTLKSA